MTASITWTPPAVAAARMSATSAGVEAQRLLDDDVLAGPGRGHRPAGVGGVVQGHVHDVDGGVGQHLPVAGVRHRDAVGAGEGGGPGGVAGGDRPDLHAGGPAGGSTIARTAMPVAPSRPMPSTRSGSTVGLRHQAGLGQGRGRGGVERLAAAASSWATRAYPTAARGPARVAEGERHEAGTAGAGEQAGQRPRSMTRSVAAGPGSSSRRAPGRCPASAGPGGAANGADRCPPPARPAAG